MTINNRLLDENIVSQFSAQQITTYFTLYIKNADVIIHNIHEEYEGKNMEALRQKAHKLKGSSMVVGAVTMKNLAQEIEESARDNQPIAPEKIHQLRDEFQQLSDLLSQRFNLHIVHQ